MYECKNISVPNYKPSNCITTTLFQPEFRKNKKKKIISIIVDYFHRAPLNGSPLFHLSKLLCPAFENKRP